jgi:hypothetical protein
MNLDGTAGLDLGELDGVHLGFPRYRVYNSIVIKDGIILKIYSLESIVLARDSFMFEDFVGKLLRHSKPGQVLIMDNASIHRTKRVQ